MRSHITTSQIEWLHLFGLKTVDCCRFDGFIICEEFKETIIAAWDEEQVNAQKREEEVNMLSVHLKNFIQFSITKNSTFFYLYI